MLFRLSLFLFANNKSFRMVFICKNKHAQTINYRTTIDIEKAHKRERKSEIHRKKE